LKIDYDSIFSQEPAIKNGLHRFLKIEKYQKSVLESSKMFNYGSRGHVFWTLTSGLRNPWIIVLLFAFPGVNSYPAKVKLKDHTLEIRVSSTELKELYYLCCLRKLAYFSNGSIVISLNRDKITIAVSELLNPRYLEMIVYAKVYESAGLELHNFDASHYLLDVTESGQHIVLKIERTRGVGIVGEVFCDQVYGRLAGNVVGKSVVDVGAFIGDTAIYFSVKGARTILAFEPDPRSFELAKENLARNDIKNVRLYNTGIKENLAEIVGLVGKVDLLKMDCEGCEHSAILSMSDKELSTIEKIVLEYHGPPGDIVKKLAHAGFAVKIEKGSTRANLDQIGFLVAEHSHGVSLH
jgi:hypothetical protein